MDTIPRSQTFIDTNSIIVPAIKSYSTSNILLHIFDHNCFLNNNLKTLNMTYIIQFNRLSIGTNCNLKKIAFSYETLVKLTYIE